MKQIVIILFIFTLSLWGTQQSCVIHLNEPEYKDGMLLTNQGGVIISPDLYIQAKHMMYINRKEEPLHKVIAMGDLMIEYGKHICVGQKIEYDFITERGVMYDGVASTNLWFLRGKKICFNADRSLSLYHASIDTSEKAKGIWQIYSPEVEITKDHFISTKNVVFRYAGIPIFWLPFFKSSLKLFTDSPIRYEISWNKTSSPQLLMHYRVYSWKEFDLFMRFYIHPLREGGVALESNYHPLDKHISCSTYSYVDHNTLRRDLYPSRSRTHYRFKGYCNTQNENKTLSLVTSYDWLNDKNMPALFNNHAFERTSIEQTKIEIDHYRKEMIFGIKGNVRVNSFQGMKQELPSLFWTLKPVEIGESGIISENRITMAYLDYVSAHNIAPFISDFNALRLSARHVLYRSFSHKGFIFTPLIGFTGIFYGNNRDNHSVIQAVWDYQVMCNLTLKRAYRAFDHTLQPYSTFQGFTRPTAPPGIPYIFSIQDGFNSLNFIEVGIRNLFYCRQNPLVEPNFIADFYFYHFFINDYFYRSLPKIQGHCVWNFSSWKLSGHIGWNVERQALDYANIGIAWTMNANFACKTELRYRGPFHWRKSDPHNFIMDVTREFSELLHSPLTDKRTFLLSRLQINITPRWILRLESHMGWGRATEPSYYESKIDFISMMSTGWQLKASFIHSLVPQGKDSHFSFGISLVKK